MNHQNDLGRPIKLNGFFYLFCSQKFPLQSRNFYCKRPDYTGDTIPIYRFDLVTTLTDGKKTVSELTETAFEIYNWMKTHTIQ